MERVGHVDEVRGLVGRLAVDGPGLDRRLVGHHRHRLAAETDERGHDRPPEPGLDLEHRAVVGNQLHDGPDVIAAAQVGRDQVGKRMDLTRRSVVRASLRRSELPGVGREVTEIAADEAERVAIVGNGVVGDAGHGRVHGGAAEDFLGDVLARRFLHERWPGREQRRALDHHDEVHERRRERAVPGRRPHHHRDRGHQPRQVRQRLEVVRRPAARLERVLRPLARALEQHDERDALLGGKLGEALALRGRSAADRAAHHREVLGADEDGPAVDEPVPGDQPVGRDGRDDTCRRREAGRRAPGRRGGRPGAAAPAARSRPSREPCRAGPGDP